MNSATGALYAGSGASKNRKLFLGPMPIVVVKADGSVAELQWEEVDFLEFFVRQVQCFPYQ